MVDSDNDFACAFDSLWYVTDYSSGSDIDPFEIFDGNSSALYASDDDTSSDQDPDSSKEGIIVERLKWKDDRPAIRCDGFDGSIRRSIDEDLWIHLPDEVMISIVCRLPFSSFSSFRSVCKKWNTLIVYPDATLMNKRHSLEVPRCVFHMGSNQFACYNPCSHSWYRLPATFVSSFGALGFSNDESKVVAGGGGLLVLESLTMGLWVVNPINKSERRLPDAGVRGCILKVHIDVNEALLSYRVFVVWDVKHGKGKQRFQRWKLELHVYDSRRDSWDVYIDKHVQDFRELSGTLEYDKELFCFLSNDASNFYALRNVSSDTVGREQQSTKICRVSRFPALPRTLQVLQLFIRNGNLMVGGVGYLYPDTECVPEHFAWIWELNFDETKWREVARVSLGTVEVFLHFSPLVYISSDYMWVTDCNYRRSDDLEFGWNGVMWHMPTNSWWKVPKLGDKDFKLKEELSRKYSKDVGECRPFLFEPNMCLVA